MLKLVMDAIIAQAQDRGVDNTVVLVTAILSMMGLVLVATITGIFNWLQSRQATRAQKAATISATSAADYAAALEAKSATVDALEEQVETLNARHKQDEADKAELRRRIEECEATDMAHALLERDWVRRIEELEAHFGRRTDSDRGSAQGVSADTTANEG